MIGGNLVLSGFGGNLIVWQPNQKMSAPNTGGVGLSVAEWRVKKLFRNKEVTHSGTGGALSFRQIALGFKFSCNLVFDAAVIQPDTLFIANQSFALRLNLGNPLINNQGGAYTAANWNYYYSPSVLLDDHEIVSNAAGDIVRSSCTGTGNSPIFFISPGTANDQTSSLQSYLQYCSNQGWTI